MAPTASNGRYVMHNHVRAFDLLGRLNLPLRTRIPYLSNGAGGRRLAVDRVVLHPFNTDLGRSFEEALTKDPDTKSRHPHYMSRANPAILVSGLVGWRQCSGRWRQRRHVKHDAACNGRSNSRGHAARRDRAKIKLVNKNNVRSLTQQPRHEP